MAVGGDVVCAAREGDGGAGEVEGVLVAVQGEFYDVGVGDEGGVVQRACGGDHGEAVVFPESEGEGVNKCGVKERFIPLDVDDVRGTVAFSSGFGDAVGASGVVTLGDDEGGADVGAEGADTLVISRDDEFIELLAEGSPLEDVLEEGLSEEWVEGFSGEAGRGPASWDDADDSCFFLLDMNPP